MTNPKKDHKTNVMRLLDQAGIPHICNYYDVADGKLDGLTVAAKIGQDPDMVFKTLVCHDQKGEHVVFVIPVGETLHLKKAAVSAKRKSVEMIPQKALLPTTGYIHGGCSPVGMKKTFPTFIDETALLFDMIFVSAGKIGTQVGVSPEALAELIGAKFSDLT